MYVPEALGTHAAPLRTLRAFERVSLAPGEQVEVRLTARVPAAATEIHVGPSADPRRQTALPLSEPSGRT